MAERKRRQNTKAHRGKSSIIEIEEGQKRRKEKRAERVKAEKAQMRREKIREKRERPKMSRGKKLAACGVMLIAGLLFVFNGYRIVDLNLDKAVYEKEYEEKVAEKARLEKELSLVDDPAYVEQQARDRFHMLRAGEILYVFPQRDAVETQ
ncbi:MAG: septum formation initiator family protein [Clostridiales Family XIII bacterium]|jgi:cell division protein FtsB|nr:septum formation initiator family protein [Clostridiales Family XIII bacterium]